MASSASHRQMVEPEISATMPLAITSSRMSGTNKRDRGTPSREGSSQASALTSTATCGGKNRRPSPPGAIFQAGEPLFKEALAPLAHHLARQVQARADLLVGPPSGRVQDDLGPHNVSIR